jgi:hypothetical protein
MKIERSVTVNVEAAHRDEKGQIHGHSYLIQCWTDVPCCLVDFEKIVREAASRVDHSVLECSVGSPNMEALGEFFMKFTYGRAAGITVKLTRVVVSRPTLGMTVEVRRD